MSPPTFVSISILLLAAYIFVTVSAGNSYLSQYTFSPPATPSHCYQNLTKCHPMNTSTCLDVILPYKYTYPPINWSSIDTNDEQQVLSQFASIHGFLSQWNGLRVIPQCWKALQSVLCTSFFPRCDEKTERVSLPAPEMCKVIRGPCRLIDQHFNWPPFLQCNDPALFPPGCPNVYEDLRFAVQPDQPTQRCQHPLVSTEDRNIWYPGIDGCAMRCDRDIFYTEAQQLLISRMIDYGSIVSMLMTGFSCATYAINWKRSNKFPQVSIFWINASLLVASLGWIVQLFKGRIELTCRADNTSRYGESEIGSSCVVSYILIYFGTMSALCWYIIYSYSCYNSYHVVENRRKNEKAPTMYYLFAFLTPSVLTFISLIFGQIDADPVYGICFVGFVNTSWRVVMVFIPFAAGVTLGTYLNICSILSLISVIRSIRKQKSIAGVSEGSAARRYSKAKHVLTRLAYTQVYVITAFIGTACISFYLMRKRDEYLQHLNSYIICNLNITDSKILTPKSPEAKALKQMELDMPYPLMREYSNHCEMLLPQPEMWPIYTLFLLYFLASFTASSWLFTSSTADIWRRFFRDGVFTSVKNRWKAKSKQVKNGQNRVTNEENGQRNVASGTGTAVWQNNTAADQSSLGFLDKAEVAHIRQSRRPSSRRRYNDPAEMDINSVTTAASQNSWSTALKESFQTFLNRRSIQFLGKTAIPSANNSARQILPTAFQNGQKPFEPSSVSQVINFQNEQSVSDSMNSHPQLDSAQHSTCTEPVGPTAGPQDDTSRNTRRRTKKERKAFIGTNNTAIVRRRGSDTSGSMISGVKNKFLIKKSTATTTTSTSTGDLPGTVGNVTPQYNTFQANQSPMQMAMPFSQQMNIQQQMNPMAQQMAHFHPQVPMVRQQFSSPNSFTHNGSSIYLGPPAFPQTVRPRLGLNFGANAMVDSGFTFTHGMSDQAANQLLNPLEQVRRPESSLQNCSTSTSGNNLHKINANRSPTIQQGNFALQTMSANQSMMINMQSQQFPQYPQFPVMYQNMAFGGVSPYVAPTSMLPNPAIISDKGILQYHTDIALQRQKQLMPPAEFQALANEREQYKALVDGRTISSASSAINFPLVISDSEGMSDTASMVSRVSKKSKSSRRMSKIVGHDLKEAAEEIKDEINDRMKQIEKQAEEKKAGAKQEENGDSVDSQFNSDSVPGPSKS